MTQQEKQAIIEKAVANAVAAQIRDDVCSRSTLAGLKSQFDFIPEEMVTASASLCGGTGSGSGSCGAYCAGLLAVGLKRNAPIAEELENPEVFERAAAAFTEYRERFTKEMGTILCPKIHEKLFGKAYDLTDPKDSEEFLNLPGHVEKCGETVGVAARIAAEMLLADE